jgi:mRNA interferase MazF
MILTQPSRGEIWQVELDPVRGHEQGGRRPCLAVSADIFNHGPAAMVIVLPITRRDRRIPSQVSVLPPEGGLADRSFIKCEDVRAVSKERIRQRLGMLSLGTLALVEDRLRILLVL